MKVTTVKRRLELLKLEGLGFSQQPLKAVGFRQHFLTSLMMKLSSDRKRGGVGEGKRATTK